MNESQTLSLTASEKKLNEAKDYWNDDVLSYIPEEDGYTIGAYIKPIALVHNELRFRYRPLEPMERAAIVTLSSRYAEKETVAKMIEILEGRIEQWTATMKVSGEIVPMPIKASWIKRLKVPLLYRLFDIVVWGREGGDPDPLKPLKEETDNRALSRISSID